MSNMTPDEARELIEAWHASGGTVDWSSGREALETLASMKAEYRVICHANDYYYVSTVFDSCKDAEHERQRRSVPEDWHIERTYRTDPEVIDRE